jgi:hypothetical protein
VPSAHWKPFASLVLEAAYEATMLAAVLNKQRGASNVVLLTLLGGGAFGNEAEWINAAIRRALAMMSGFGLDARLVKLWDDIARDPAKSEGFRIERSCRVFLSLGRCASADRLTCHSARFVAGRA